MLIALESTPPLRHVDPAIFKLRYFALCTQCTFCNDSCCQYGADVNVGERDRILAHAESIRKLVDVPVEQWFETDVKEDPEYPTGKYVRTGVVDGACAFLNRKGRGCLLHAWALEHGRDYHDVKPLVCWMFPVIYDQGVLRASHDVTDGLICADQGMTLYRGARSEIARFFGLQLVEELDEIEKSVSNLG